MLLMLLGALLVIIGVAYLLFATIRRGRMSELGRSPGQTETSLEPPRSGLRASGHPTWPGHVMIGIGLVLLLLPLFWATPTP